MRVRWLHAALTNLDTEFRYIAEDDPIAAASTAMRVVRSVEQLRRYPFLGRPGRIAGTRELVVNGTPYIVPYRIRAGSVEVLRVFHGARKWPEKF